MNMINLIELMYMKDFIIAVNAMLQFKEKKNGKDTKF